MPLYSYTADLAPKVESGGKNQTYRTKRKIRPKVGQKAHNYAGGYSTKRQHLGSPEITDVIDVLIGGKGIIFYHNGPGEYCLTDPVQLDMEARLDGFGDWQQMRDYFAAAHDLPVELDLIKWEPERWERKFYSSYGNYTGFRFQDWKGRCPYLEETGFSHDCKHTKSPGKDDPCDLFGCPCVEADGGLGKYEDGEDDWSACEIPVLVDAAEWEKLTSNQ